MAAQALYLKYRPQTFDQVVGQEPITRTLRNALREGRVRHAYLFTGTRGTGKTTTARLLAKAVNCLAPEDQRPCNTCSLCLAVNEGRLLDLIEIDAASNRGIDEIRDIREKVGFRPNEGRFKVYVLDEAHMLTEPAFNALLKTLEEPPPHVIFVLVTTDPQKIPATITSRCQRFDFKRIPVQAVVAHLAYVAAREGLRAQPEALELIAQQGTGAMRDALSLLDQLTSYGDEISLDQARMVLGTVGGEAAARVAACLASGDVASGLDWIDRTVADGADPRQFGHEIVQYLRGLLLVHEGAGTRLLNATAEQAAEMEALAARLPLPRLMRAIRLFNEATTDLRRGFQTIPQLSLEMALVESLMVGDGGPGATRAGGEGQKTAAVSTPAAEPGPEPPGTRAVGGVDRPAPGGEERTWSTMVAPGGPAVRFVAEGADLQATPAPARPEVGSSQPRPAPASEPPAAPLRPTEAQTMPAPSRSLPVEGGEAAMLPASGTTSLSLRQVQEHWEDILRSLRSKKHLATEAVLRSSTCVEVYGVEIVVTPPSQILMDKLSDPQRLAEIQKAMDEVLGVQCQLKFVLAANFRPRSQPSESPRSQPAESPQPQPAVKLPAQAPTPSPEPPARPETNPEMGEGDMDQLRGWVTAVGGQIVEG